MSPQPSSTVDERLKTLFSAYLPKAGIRLSRGEDEDDSSITLAKADSVPLVGEVRHLNPATAVGIEGLVMRGMLRHLKLKGPNLLVIVVPRLSQGMILEVMGHVGAMEDGVKVRKNDRFNWLVLAGQGGCIASLRSWEIKLTQADSTEVRFQEATSPSDHLSFSDTNQKILKSLLYAWLAASHTSWSSTWWGGRTKGYGSVAELAAASHVGAASVYRLMGALWERKLAAPKQVALLSVGSLLEEWIRARPQDPRFGRTPVRPLFLPRGASSSDWLQYLRIPEDLQVAVSGWHALNRHNQLSVLGKLPLTLVAPSRIDVHLAMDKLRLVPCDADQAWGFLGQAATPRSTFAGVVRINGQPTVDIWQAALDVATDPNRGREQAEHVKHLLAITA